MRADDAQSCYGLKTNYKTENRVGMYSSSQPRSECLYTAVPEQALFAPSCIHFPPVSLQIKGKTSQNTISNISSFLFTGTGSTVMFWSEGYRVLQFCPWLCPWKKEVIRKLLPLRGLSFSTWSKLMENEGKFSALKWLLTPQRPQFSWGIFGMQDDHLPNLVFTWGAYIW